MSRTETKRADGAPAAAVWLSGSVSAGSGSRWWDSCTEVSAEKLCCPVPAAQRVGCGTVLQLSRRERSACVGEGFAGWWGRRCTVCGPAWPWLGALALGQVLLGGTGR